MTRLGRSAIGNLRPVHSGTVTVPQRTEIHASLQAAVGHPSRRRQIDAAFQRAVGAAELTHGCTASDAHVANRDLVHPLHIAHRSHDPNLVRSHPTRSMSGLAAGWAPTRRL